jgi:membrane-bound lytic murein transglycosylase D
LFKIFLIIATVFISANASLIGSNFSQRDLQILKELDIDPAYITDYKLQKTYNRYLQNIQDKYVNRFNRASLFVPKVKEILREEGLPETFLYLAMAESSFTLDAKSSARATGMWQFMHSTAKNLGLKNDIYVDERMDIVKSTYAAAKYLNYLHDQFGKWYIAAVAYNCGQGRVIEAITRATIDLYEDENGKKNDKANDIKEYRRTITLYQQKRVKFRELNKIYKEVLTWDVKPDIYELLMEQKDIRRQYLPEESRSYIRKIIALAMMNNQSFVTENDHAHIRNIGVSSPIATVSVKGGLHLKNIAKAIGMEYRDLKMLNKHIVRNVIPTYEKEYDIYIPYSRLSIFNQNKMNIEPTKYKVHIVKRGDNLFDIGRKYGISYKAIKSFNKLKSNKLALSQKLIIPFVEGTELKTKDYYVKTGDTLLSIAKMHRVDIDKLMSDNKLKNSLIKKGDKLVITYR